MAQRAVGEDDVWEGKPIAKKFNFKEESYWQLLMSYGEREKWVEEVYTPKFNFHIPCEGGELQKKEVCCNLNNAPKCKIVVK